jgi:heme exporter protein C
VWEDATLVSFLIVFLLYCTYQPLRFSIEDREKQSRYASVFAVTAGVFTPVNFLAVRLADSYIHPQTLDSTENLPGAMKWAFLLSLLGMTSLYITLWKFELTHKHARAQVKALKRRLGAGEVVRGRSAAPEPTVS